MHNYLKEGSFSPGAFIQKLGLKKGGMSGSNRGAIRGLRSIPRGPLTTYRNGGCSWRLQYETLHSEMLPFLAMPRPWALSSGARRNICKRACLKEHWIKQNQLHHSIYLTCLLLNLIRPQFCFVFFILKMRGSDWPIIKLVNSELLKCYILAWFIQR